MNKESIPKSWTEDKPEIPPPRVEDKFERWHETYSVDRLKDLTISDIKSAELEFRSEVEALKAEYRPGRLVNPAMAQIAGKEPFTQEEFREVRQEISDEAEQIQMKFKQAKGLMRKEQERQRANFLSTTISQAVDSLTNINISIELPKLK